jgi:hypothetical protein
VFRCSGGKVIVVGLDEIGLDERGTVTLAKT